MFSKEPEKDELSRYFIVQRVCADRKLSLWISAIFRGVGVVDKKWNFEFPLMVSSLPHRCSWEFITQECFTNP